MISVRFLRVMFVGCVSSVLMLSGCGGSSTGGSITSGTTNPTPSILSIAPVNLVAGSPTQTVTVTGTGFTAATVLTLNGTALTTTYVSATSLTVVIPASAIAADGTVKFMATNPAPGGGASAVDSYIITVPTATLTGISQQNIPQGSGGTITVTGTGFEANSIVTWNGSPLPTTYVNNTTLEVTLTSVVTQSLGAVAVSVSNPGLVPTTPLDLQIVVNVPMIYSLNPWTIGAVTGSTIAQQVSIIGSGFAANATVQANGQSVSVISQTDQLIVVSLSASFFTKAGMIPIVVSNPGTPVVSSNSVVLTVTAPVPAAFTVQPTTVAAGSGDTTITLWGTGFYADSSVEWNNTPLATTYIGPNSVTAVIPEALLAEPTLANINVSTPENSVQAPAQPFDTYLSLAVNDILYNPMDGYIYASVPGSGGQNQGNSIVAIDPTTGVIRRTIFVGSEPNRLALSTDDTQLFVGLDGAGAVRQVNLTTGTAGTQTSLGGGPGVYNPPYTALGLAAVPGLPNSFAVYGTDGVVKIFDSGVERPNNSSGLQTYFDSNVGSLAFGSSASTLYVMSNAIGGYLYQLTVDATGVTQSTQIGTGTAGTTLQYDNGLLYTPTGIVLNASNGTQAGQFSVTSSNSNSPVAASGPIFSDSALNRAWVLPQSFNGSSEIIAYDETTYNQVGSVSLGGISSSGVSGNPADLIMWGQDGLAFHTSDQLYLLHGPIVKDTTGSPADISVTMQAPATQTTGTAMTYTIQVENIGPNRAQGVSLTAVLDPSLIDGNVQTAQGTCSGSGEFYCDLGSIASGGSATVTITATPTTSGTVQASANVASVSYDAVATNNQASVSTTVTGGLYSAPPVVTQLSPALVQAGSATFTLTVDGSGFSSASTVVWDGQNLPTTFVSAGQLTASVDTSLIGQLGWASVSVATAAPGGGQSNAEPFSVYQLLNVSANAIDYDPFTRKIYAVLPSTSTSLTGNSIVAIDPSTGLVGTPISVGSEPNLLSETSDGNYLYIGLSGAKALGRFNLLQQSLDATIPIPANQSYTTGDVPAIAIATMPGSDTTLAVEAESFYGIGIFDINGSTGTFRTNSSFGYSGDNPVFVDSTHFYAYDATTTGAEFYRYSVDANGVTLIDGTTLDGMDGFGGVIAVDGGLVYGAGGGIVNPSTTPPSQVAVLQLGSGIYGNSLYGGGVVPYAAEAKSFNIAINAAGTAMTFLERFDTQHFTAEQTIELPADSMTGITGTRWGQDGLAYLLTTTTYSYPNTTTTQIFLIRGPFVLPAEAGSNPAPSLSTTDHNTITAGSGNVYITVTGSGFLPGASVLWNGSARTTNYIDSAHLSVAISAADVQTAATETLSCENPGSTSSNSINITVQ